MIRIKWLARLIKRMTDAKVLTKADVSIGGEENPYLRRWFIIPRNKWFNIYLHEIVRSDDDRALHDHPWWNVSFILDGELLEVTPINTMRIVRRKGPFQKTNLKAGQLRFRGAETPHRLEVREGVVCRTLFMTGPRVREWGFHCPNGWRHWKIFTSFDETGDATRIGRGCGEQ